LQEGAQDASGTVVLDARTGAYTVTLEGMPAVGYGEAYIGWIDGIQTLAGNPFHTDPLNVSPGGNLEAQLETGWVDGARIEYFYVLGLAYFYMDQCERSYPLFNAALEIDPEDANALEGLRLCQQAEGE
jgi:hypothetical protein